MTHFERDFLLQRSTNNLIKTIKTADGKTVADFTQLFQENRENTALQLNYRELDRLSKELDDEIKKVKALRMELEKYKAEFSISIEDEATKKIEEVINGIGKMFK